MATTLQINLAPTDLPHMIHILPHQLKQLGGQVDEILLTMDLHQSRGRFGAAWKERLPGFLELVKQQLALHPHMRAHEVDYTPATVKRISERFFGSALIPPKDWNGGPFYSYFSGFDTARNDYILHIDSDMMFGGGSQTWISEAEALMETSPDVLAFNPHPGPPAPDGKLTSQVLEPLAHPEGAFRSDHFNSRVALFDRRRLISRLGPIPLLQPSRFRCWQASLEGNFPYMLPEAILTVAMRQAGLHRVDFLGKSPGLWSIHPPHRNASFYERLPSLIQRVEAGDMPKAQLGDYDVNDSLVDWSSVRKTAWSRKLGRLRLIANQLQRRVWPTSG